MDQLPACRLLSWLGLLLTTLPVSFAQNQPLRFEHFRGQPGILFNSTKIMQDRKGFLWFGFGNQGLAKYDGNRFTNYRFDPLDSASLSDNTIRGLWEDSAGLIWIGTGEATCRFDPRTETFTRLERGPANPFALKAVSSFNEDREGNLWVGVDELRQVNQTTGRYSSTDYAPLLGVVFDSNSILKQDIPVIYSDKSGTLWIGSLTGLHQLVLTPQGKDQPSKISFTHYRHDPADSSSLSHNRVVSIYEDRRGMLWIGTDGGGLNSLNRTTGRFIRYQPDPKNPQSISSNSVTSIAEDQQGNLWVATDKGLNKLNPGRTSFTRYSHDPLDASSLSNNNIFFSAGGSIGHPLD